MLTYSPILLCWFVCDIYKMISAWMLQGMYKFLAPNGRGNQTLYNDIWFVGPECGTCFMLYFWDHEFWDGYFLECVCTAGKSNMVPSWNDCRHINAALHSCCVVNLDTAVNIAELLSIAEEVKHEFSLLCCRVTKYVVLLSAYKYMKVFMWSFLFNFNQIM